MIDIAARELGIDPSGDAAAQSAHRRGHALSARSASRRTTASAMTECDSGDYRVTLRSLPRGIRLGAKEGACRHVARRPLSRHRRRLLHRRRCVRPARKRAHGGRSRTARSTSMSDRPRSAKASRPSWRRSRPTRSKSRWIDVRVLHGSTNYLKEGFGSYGSRATVMGGSADRSGGRGHAQGVPQRRRGAFRRRA